jgi:hypothetical protein
MFIKISDSILAYGFFPLAMKREIFLFLFFWPLIYVHKNF